MTEIQSQRTEPTLIEKISTFVARMHPNEVSVSLRLIPQSILIWLPRSLDCNQMHELRDHRFQMDELRRLDAVQDEFARYNLSVKSWDRRKGVVYLTSLKPK